MIIKLYIQLLSEIDINELKSALRFEESEIENEQRFKHNELCYVDF
jgi:hypothetical protein